MLPGCLRAFDALSVDRQRCAPKAATMASMSIGMGARAIRDRLSTQTFEFGRMRRGATGVRDAHVWVRIGRTTGTILVDR